MMPFALGRVSMAANPSSTRHMPCAWCAELTTLGPDLPKYCVRCGHRADVAPDACTCARCEIAI